MKALKVFFTINGKHEEVFINELQKRKGCPSS